MTDHRPTPRHIGQRRSAAPDRRWLALAVIGVAQLMIILDASIVNIALPKAQAALHISDASRQWALTAYTLTFGGLLLLGGRIADYVGRKRTFLIGLFGFAAASALGGAAQSAAWLFSARAIQGIFAALLAPAVLSLITTTFTEPHERAKAFGVYGAISGTGGAIGLIAGGALTEYLSWRWTLFVNVPIALGVAIASLPLLKESRVEGDRHYDVLGALLATLRPRVAGLRIHRGIAALLDGATDPRVDRHRSASCCAVFVLWEPVASNPMLPAAGRPRPQPRRVLPRVPAGDARRVHRVPVPDLLLPGRAGLLSVEGRRRLPAVPGRRHRVFGHRFADAAALRSAGRLPQRASSWPRWASCG